MTIETPPTGMSRLLPHPVAGWLTRLAHRVSEVIHYDVIFDPASVAANTTAEQTVTVKGLQTTDRVVVSKPSHDAGLGIVGARVSAADTLAITLMNCTGSAIDAGSETYRVTVLRP